jgi:hypothetical protein
MTDKDNTGSVRITNKQIYEGLNDINKSLALHNQRLELHIEHESRKLIDHEDRIRKIEESVWRSSWVTSIITALITAVVGAAIITTVGF